MRSSPLISDVFAAAPALAAEAATLRVGAFERLPKWLNCIPLVLQWIWLSLRYRSATLPSASNPAITSGGLVGEGKLEYFEHMGNLAKSCTAPYLAIENKSGITAACVCDQLAAAGLHFPIVAKPDLGWCGYGVRLLRGAGDLGDYLSAFPKNQRIILQRYLPQPCEAGVFYVRHPGAAAGEIIGISLRSFPQVIGDGVSSIAQLVSRDERMRRIRNRLHRPDFDPHAVPALGEKVRLATIGSTRVGGLYRDGSDSITPALTRAFDAICHDMPEFHIGRFDIRFESLDDLRAGRNFTIMEVNGAGSEAIHAWDPKYSMWQSFAIIFAKQRLIFELGAENRQRGRKPISVRRLAALHFHQQRLIKEYPPSN